jgi:hypothetical protein
MPNIMVSLDVRAPGIPPGTNWTSTTAQNGTVYSYKYSGGSDGNGNANIDTHGQQVIVNLACDARYHVTAVTLNDPDHNVTKSFTTRQVTLTDDDDNQNYDVYYSITITDTTANTSFTCDPTIHNDE